MIVKVKTFADLREVFGGEIKLKLKEGAVLKDLLSPVFLPPEAVEAIMDSESGEIKPPHTHIKEWEEYQVFRRPPY